ncbi:hypothetical protein CFBP6625_08090 [Agrobacterium tumefaciens]|nr:hypothetical protein CFBP6625_08090 [Agrobacterium tumefaciens]
MSKNVFDKLAQREHENDTKLGMPSTDVAHFDRRMHLMSSITGGNGWSKLPKEPRKFSDGTTRGDRKRGSRRGADRSSGRRPHHAVSVCDRGNRRAWRLLVALLPPVRTLITHWQWLIVIAAAAYIAAIIFTAPPH